MLMYDTLLTRESMGEAVQATVRRAVHTARFARRVGPQALVPHELVSELISILKPLLKVCLYARMLAYTRRIASTRVKDIPRLSDWVLFAPSWPRGIGGHW